MRILVIRRDNIGDLVCTTPLFAALRERYPDAHIAALVNSYNAPVLDGNPALDAVHSYTKFKHRSPGESWLSVLLARLRLMAELRRAPYDYVVLAKADFDLRGLRTARQLRRRRVIGFSRRNGRAPRAITDPVPSFDYDELHEVEVLERLAAVLDVPEARGPLQVFPSQRRMERWRDELGGLPSEHRWVAVHISAREPSRRWPAERWIDLVGRLQADGKTRVLLVWAPGRADDPRHPGDDEKASAIRNALPVAAAPTRELADLIAVLALCHAFIGADGGAMHIGAGLALPMVALFENIESKKRRWAPWRVPHELVAPATRDIADITVEQVLAAWQRLAGCAITLRHA